MRSSNLLNRQNLYLVTLASTTLFFSQYIENNVNPSVIAILPMSKINDSWKNNISYSKVDKNLENEFSNAILKFSKEIIEESVDIDNDILQLTNQELWNLL